MKARFADLGGMTLAGWSVDCGELANRREHREAGQGGAADRVVLAPRVYNSRTCMLQCMSPVMADAVEKVPKCLLAIFSKETKLNYVRRLIWHPGRCRSRLWVFSLGDEVPHIFIRESHQRPRKILISGGKRLFQQHRPDPVNIALQVYGGYQG